MLKKYSVKLFYSYAHEDEALRDMLDKHLALLIRDRVIECWHDREIGEGREWRNEIDKNLEAADIILLLVSANFLASDYCFDVEIKCAMQRHDEKSAVVIPIMLRPCDTDGAEFMKLQGLPKDFKPVTTWNNQDEAFSDIAKGIRAVAESIRNLGINAIGANANDWTQGVAPDVGKSFFQIGENPYQGLGAFNEEDAERFSGRDEEIQKFLRQFLSLIDIPLEGPVPVRILPVLGPSGSGKSSLVRAGLVPSIRRVFTKTGKGTLKILIFSPRSRPLRQLAIELARLNQGDSSKMSRIKEYEALLNQKSNGRYDGMVGIADALDAEAPAQTDQHLLIVVDQFEEIYTLMDRFSDRKTSDTEADIFVANLLEAAADRGGRIMIIIILRSDFFDKLAHRHKALVRVCTEQKSLVGPLAEDGLRRAIAEPAARAGHPLSEIVINQLVTQTLNREGALPLLQAALGAIWEGMRQGIKPEETLHKLGGIGGALHERAESLFIALNETEQNLVRYILLAMVQIGENAPDTRRRIQVDELITNNDNPARLERVLLYLAGTVINPVCRPVELPLITLSGDDNGVRYAEIVHEAMLQSWDRLRDWIEANRDNLRIREWIRERIRVWQTKGEPNDRLLPRGSELEDGRKLIKMAKEIPIADIESYVQRSITYANGRRRFTNLSIAVICLLFATLVLSFKQNEEMVSNNTTRELSALTMYAARELDLWTKDHILITRELSTSKIIISAISSLKMGKSKEPQLAIEYFLRAMNKRLETALELSIIDTNGELIASSVTTPTKVLLPRRDWSQSHWLQSSVALQWNTHYTTATLDVSVPILSKDDFILGELIATFNLRDLQSALKDTTKSPEGELLLLDSEGKVMLASHVEVTSTTFLDYPVLQHLRERLGESSIFEGISHRKVIGLAYSSTKPPITLVAERDYEKVYGDWIQLRNLFLTLASLLALLAATVAIRMRYSK